ncbi:DUF6453 family protein [Pantoea agglomerans]|uniref:DUF6453 family protein n=1 Tax=Enterobacter agglomerans TaxID=549 RepID=UPI002412FE7C|nr:DUF6453 family protein [Pantoea agglomerans]
MTYGLRITPDDGGKALVLDGSTRFISYLASLSLNGGNRTRQVKTPPSDSTALIVPRRMVSVFPTVNNPVMYYLTGWNLAANGTFTYSVGGGDGVERSTLQIADVDIFSVAGGGGATGYGIRITNGADFMEINDTTYLGYVTYRGTVNVVDRWLIPAEVLALGSAYVVFARWNNTDSPLFLNRDNNSIEVYSAFASTDGSKVGGTVSNVQIVIVSCGYSPALPASGYGLVIRNAAGQVTFSSRFPPVMYRGGAYNFPAWQNFDTSGGEILSWTNPSGSVSQPMIPLCSIGLQRGDYSRSQGGWQYRIVLYSGFKMSGNAVSVARARSAGAEAAVTLFVKAMQVACSLPCLDAADYF